MKTVLVTGATDGIGRETARQLLQKGYKVLVHGRSLEKASRVLEKWQGAMPSAEMEAVYGNFESMDQVVDLAGQVRSKAPALDVLINNAGVYEPERHLTSDGFELTMAINYFAVFLLTHRLLDALKAAPQGRIITVSSVAHESAALDLDDLTFSKGYSGYKSYAASKLADILFTKALAKRLAGTSVTANCLHPGVIATKLLHAGFGPGGAPPEQGASTPAYLASADEVAGVSGAYFIDYRPQKPSRAARDEKLAEALWQKSEELLRPFLS